MNLFTYYFMAPPVLAALGNVGFLGLYLGGTSVSRISHVAGAGSPAFPWTTRPRRTGGVVCSLTSMVWHSAVKHVDKSSCGASGT